MWQKFSIRSQLILVMTLLLSFIEAATLGFIYWSDKNERHSLAIEQTHTLNRAMNQDLLKVLISPQVTKYSDISFRLSGFDSVSALGLLNKKNEVIYNYFKPGSHVLLNNATSIQSTPTFIGETLFMRQPLIARDYEYGAVVYAIDLTSYKTQLIKQMTTLTLVFPFLLFIGLALAWWFSKRFTQPITELANAIKTSDVKNYQFKQVSINAENEIAVLYDGYNNMIGQIEKSTSDLQRAISNKEKADLENRAKSSFLANMSHELRTPLNAILGYSEIIKEDASAINQTQIVADVEKVNSAGTYLLSLINSLLDLSKIEADKMEVNVESISIEDLVDEVVTTIKPLFAKNGNVISVTIHDDIHNMSTDKTKLRQILINLLSNANKFTDNGKLYLDVQLDNKNNSHYCLFKIRDTGIGIAAAKLTKLFKPFAQVSDTSVHDYGGTGLGLAISKRFCEILGGDISVQSEIGKGSTFTLRLPMVSRDTQAVA